MADNKNVTLYINTKGASASLRELTSDSNKLRNELARLEPTSKEFIEKSKDFKKVGERLREVRQDMNGVKQEMDIMGKGFPGFRAGLMAAFSFGAILEAGRALIGFFVDGVKKNAELNQSLSDLRAITGVSKDELKFFRQEALKASNETGIAAAKIVEAYKLIGSAKPELLSNKEALAGITKEAIALSQAAGMELPAAASALTDMLNQFGEGADKASQFVNVLAAGSKEGAAEIPEITEAALKFGLVADGMNVSVEESVALIELLAEKGEKGAEAGTKLRNVLLNISNSKGLPKEALAAFEKAGVDVDKLSNKSLSLEERLRETSKLLQTETGMLDVFGKENVVAATAVLQGITRFDQLSKAVTGTATAYEQAAIATDNLKHDYEEMATVIENKQIAMGESNDSLLRDVTQFATEVVKNAEPVEEAFGAITETMGNLFESLGRVINQFLPFNTKSEGASTLMKVLATSINTLFIPLRLIATGLNLIVDGFNAVINTGKEVSNFFGSEFKVEPNLGFDKMLDNLVENGKKIVTSYGDIWTDNKETVEQSVKEQDEILKALADEEKKRQEDITKKKEEETKKQKKDREEAEKNIRKLQIDNLTNSLGDRVKKLQLQSADEIAQLKGTEQQKAQQRTLIENKLQQDIQKLRDDHGKDVSKKVSDAAKKEADAKLKAEEEYFEKKKAADFARNDMELILARNNADQILEVKLERLRLERDYELENKEITEAEKLLIHTRYNEQVDMLHAESREKMVAQTKDQITQGLNFLSQGIQIVQGFSKLKNDKDISDAEETKDYRIEQLDQELKSKRITQEQYDSARKKAEIEADNRIREIKTKQAQGDKRAAIAQAAIQLSLGILKALPNPFLVAATTAVGLAQIALIAATPIPKFAKGGSTNRGIKGYKTGMPNVKFGGYVDQPMVAEFGEEGAEYVVPNWMMKDPMIGNMVGMMESIRTGGETRGFAVGGPTLPSASTGSKPSSDNSNPEFAELIQEVKALRSDVRNFNGRIRAYIPFDELEQTQEIVEAIRSESKLT